MLRKTNVFPTARQKRASFASSLTLSNPAKDGAVTGSHRENEHQREQDRIPVLRSGNTRFDGMLEVPTFGGGPEPPEEAYAPPARAWGHHHGAVPGAAEPEDLADIEGGHYPPAVAVTRLAIQKSLLSLVYHSDSSVSLRTYKEIHEPVATAHSGTR